MSGEELEFLGLLKERKDQAIEAKRHDTLDSPVVHRTNADEPT